MEFEKVKDLVNRIGDLMSLEDFENLVKLLEEGKEKKTLQYKMLRNELLKRRKNV